MPSIHSGRLRPTSVSSIRSANKPPVCRAWSQLKRAVRTLPTWSSPVGAGEYRTRTSASGMFRSLRRGAVADLFQETPGYDHALHLVRPFVDLGDLRIAHHALDGIAPRVPR